MNAQTDIILNQDGEVTDLAVPDDFGNGLAFLNPSDMPDLDGAEVGINITPESVEFKNAGESLRAVFNGFTFLNVKDRVNGGYVDRKAAVLQTKTGIKINMGANLLKQLALIPVGTAIQITYKGLERTAGGNDVKVYDVNLLNVPRANIHSMPHAHRPAAPAQPQKTSNDYDENAPIEIVDTLHFWAVTEAANHWNIAAGDAAKQIAKAGLGKMDKREFLDWLKNPPETQAVS